MPNVMQWGCRFVFFFVIHIVQVILAGWGNFSSVISGFEVVNETPQLAIESIQPLAEAPKPPAETPQPIIHPEKDHEKAE